MVQSTSLLLLSLAAAGTIAAPTAKHAEPFSIVARSNKPVWRNGPNALRKAYKKYHVPLPPALETLDIQINSEKSTWKRQDNSTGQGSVPAKSANNDEQYVCEVDIGGQKLKLDFDTGSSDLWVFSTELDEGSQKGHNCFDPKKSSSFKKMDGATWKIQYGDQSSAGGSVGIDKVTIGGITVEAQAVELAAKISKEFVQDSNSDGLLGLAMSAINTVQPKPVETWADNAMANLKDKLFVADLQHNEDGSYDFGYLDSKKFDGEPTYVETTTSNGFWEYSVSIAGGSNSSSIKADTTAIADTGTTLLLVPEEDNSAYYKNVQGAKMDQQLGGWTFPCDAKLPPITFSMGSEKITLQKYLNYGPATQGEMMKITAGDPGACFGGIQPMPSMAQHQKRQGSMPGVIMGDVFFKEYYGVFNLDKNQFGFKAKASGDSTISEPTFF